MNLLKVFIFYVAIISTAMASPGAHGPNGEHLDTPGGHVHTDAGPRIETFTESFELVGRVQGDELSILIDRYETNEPVLNGTLEVEFNGLKAPAKFHSDHGDYAVDDERFLKALAQPGKHSLVFTLTTGNESDLLEGTLEVAADDHGHDHPHDGEHGHAVSLTTWAIVGGLLTVVFAAIAIGMLRRDARKGK